MRVHGFSAICAMALLPGVAGCSTAPNTAQSDHRGEPVKVLILGDSISMGYTQPLRDRLGDSAHVHRPMRAGGTRAENCEGTTKGVEAIDRWLEIDGGSFDVIHFNFGLHDIKRVDPETGRALMDPTRRTRPRSSVTSSSSAPSPIVLKQPGRS